MNVPGDADPLYVAAREVLLDGLAALTPHHDAVILVGAQAVYLHTGDTDLAVAPYTTDADVTLHPGRLEAQPLLEDVMGGAGFRPGAHPGIWLTTRTVAGRPVEVGFDLLVPDSMGGGGRRGARLPHHGNTVARKAKGLEAALVDHISLPISTLEGNERRREVLVASPSALLVAKLHKLGERNLTPERLKAKDAHDVLRLLRSISTEELVRGFVTLRSNTLSWPVTAEALAYLRQLFSNSNAVGPQLAAEAAAGLEAADVIADSCAALANDLLDAVGDD